MSDAIHVDVCPECGTATTYHGLDPAPHCPHGFERRVPVVYVPAEVTDEMIGRAWGAMCRAENLDGRSLGVAMDSVRAALEAALNGGEG